MTANNDATTRDARNRWLLEQIRLLERDDELGTEEFVRTRNKRSMK